MTTFFSKKILIFLLILSLGLIQCGKKSSTTEPAPPVTPAPVVTPGPDIIPPDSPEYPSLTPEIPEIPPSEPEIEAGPETGPGPEVEPEPEPISGPVDADGDGYPSDTDCNDTNANINPAATETCDSLDNDCDGQIDEGAGSNWYPDVDNDTYGDSRAAPVIQCLAPAHHVADNTDCEDTMHWVNPHELELCDSVDNNCNGQINEGFDQDNDSVTTCGGDCNDTNANINPLASETCDSLDNDCDGNIDENPVTGGNTYYLDSDGDGYGANSSTVTACNPPSASWITVGDDCDDINANMNPGETEVCNDGFDNDCDGGPNECLPPSGVINLADVDSKFVGEGFPKNLGSSISSAGDVNDDGYDDFLMGAPMGTSSSNSNGAAYLFYGSANSYVPTSVSAAGIKFAGVTTNDKAGWAVAGMGDMNGDGSDDLVVSAPYRDGSKGYVYLVYNPAPLAPDTNIFGLANASAALIGETNGALTGFSVARYVATATSTPYLLIGAQRQNGNRGAVYRVLGGFDTAISLPRILGDEYLSQADQKFSGTNGWDLAGQSVASAFHANWDTDFDYAIGAPGSDINGSSSGTVYIYYSTTAVSATNPLANAPYKLLGEAVGDGAGSSIAPAGNVGGYSTSTLSYEDLLVGAPNSDANGVNSGKAYLLDGGTIYDSNPTENLASAAQVEFIGEGPNNYAGVAVSSAGDVNGDGYDDVLIGARGYNNDTGATYLFYGPLLNGVYNLSEADAKFVGEAAGDKAGMTVANAGDVNGDGYGDILIGAPMADWNAALNVGIVYLIYGGGGM